MDVPVSQATKLEPIRVLVAEDEPVPRRRLARMLSDEPGVHVVAQCSGGREAVARIVEEQPDIVFLDVQMPDLDGFGVLEAVGLTRLPAVVFVTAYDAHAVRAFDVHAADYLLKPFTQERLRTALARARARLQRDPGAPHQPGADAERLGRLLRAVAEHAPAPASGGGAGGGSSADYITVRTDTALRLVRVADIDWLESEGNYVRVHVGRDSYLVRQTSAHLEAQLDPRRFARIHRRYLVNISRVYEIQPWFGGDAVIVLRDGTRLRLSRTYREQFHGRFLGETGAHPGQAKPA
jgi:two-component system LytT family response regulator